MNPPPAPPTSPPVLPALAAPNKTLLTSDKHSFRRPSLYQNNSSSPISPASPPYMQQQSPTNELSDSFASLGAISRSSSSTTKPLPVLPSSGITPSSQTPTSTTTAAAAASTTPATTITTSTTLPSSSTAMSYSTTSPPPLKNPSHHFSATHTIALKALCSTAALDLKDTTFWASLLNSRKFSAKHTIQDAFDLEMDTVGLSIELAANNIKTQNLNKLLLHLLSQLHLLKGSNTLSVPNPAYNSLFLARVFLKHFVGNLTHVEIVEQFKGDCPLAKGDNTDLDPENLPILPQVIDDDRPKAEQLLDILLTLLINIDSK
ncbi:hypothetical protein BCR42DRAFT_191120 [Absidia repens]|uniref:Dymeclin n=1 Tax=Absidia repens TaxID=90262 RepID=A0A1X2IS25_9FUNG|nr:hypothetical protein BCR42DRAFT_191120 [Absidia repens]